MNLESKTGQVTAVVEFTEGYVNDAVRHYRLQQRALSRLLTAFKYLLAVPLAAMAVYGLYRGAIHVGLVSGGACVLLFTDYFGDGWWVRRFVKMGGWHNQTIAVAFNDAEVRAESPTQTITLRWPSFTKAAHFQDGFLLFTGPAAMIWIPAASISEPDGVAALERLLRNKIAEHKVIDRRMAPAGHANAAEGPPAPAGEAGR